MLTWVSPSVVDGQENQTNGAPDREEDGHDRAELVQSALIRHQLASMSQPALRQEG